MKQETSALVEKLVAESKLTPYHESCSSDEEVSSTPNDKYYKFNVYHWYNLIVMLKENLLEA